MNFIEKIDRKLSEFSLIENPGIEYLKIKLIKMKISGIPDKWVKTQFSQIIQYLEKIKLCKNLVNIINEYLGLIF